LSRASTGDGLTELFRVDGKSGITYAREVHVNTSTWPDYVFRKGYALKSFAQLRTYIAENGHLPGMPTEAEVTKNGFDLGQANRALTEKVEELTLYVLQLEARMAQLEAVNAQTK
jgi:hypothetical protein